MPISVIILAAGRGTRMKSGRAKVLHEVAHAPLLQHAMAAGRSLDPERIVVVAGHEAEAVRFAAMEHDPGAAVVLQEAQLGTAHAVAQARSSLGEKAGDVIVLYGDTPFIRPETLGAMAQARARHAVVLLGFEPRDPGRYGRLIMDGDELVRIVEFKDASEDERRVGLCNSGVIVADRAILFDLIAAVRNENASGEYYLTDIVDIARKRGLSAGVVTCDEDETLGVNSRADLARAEAVYQQRARAAALENGITLVAPDTVFFAHDTLIGRDTVIEPHVVFGPCVTVEPRAEIRAFSHLEGCRVGSGAVVGPYARLRPGADLARDVRVGNFVEIKRAKLEQGAKVNHLTYVGDAAVGAKANIGAGSVTCNFDGVSKHRTEIGARAFIGSDTMLVAPVKIGADAMTASGSVITDDVPDGALALGRARQENKPSRAVKIMERLKAVRARAQRN